MRRDEVLISLKSFSELARSIDSFFSSSSSPVLRRAASISRMAKELYSIRRAFSRSSISKELRRSFRSWSRSWIGADFGHVAFKAAEAVEELAVTGDLDDVLVLVLAVNVDQVFGDFLELGGGNLDRVGEGPALAAGIELAPEDERIFIAVDAGFVEHLPYLRSGGDVEARFKRGFFEAGP